MGQLFVARLDPVMLERTLQGHPIFVTHLIGSEFLLHAVSFHIGHHPCAGGQLADDEEEDMDEAPLQLEAPSKIVTTNTTISVRARVACFDCQGKSDARSIREILVQVAPQQLILIHALPQVRPSLHHQHPTVYFP